MISQNLPKFMANRCGIAAPQSKGAPRTVSHGFVSGGEPKVFGGTPSPR
jgi:hypothetical protein